MEGSRPCNHGTIQIPVGNLNRKLCFKNNVGTPPLYKQWMLLNSEKTVTLFLSVFWGLNFFWFWVWRSITSLFRFSWMLWVRARLMFGWIDDLRRGGMKDGYR